MCNIEGLDIEDAWNHLVSYLTNQSEYEGGLRSFSNNKDQI